MKRNEIIFRDQKEKEEDELEKWNGKERFEKLAHLRQEKLFDGKERR